MNKNYETPDIIGVKALDNYLIYLKYKTNEERIYNMENLINENKFYKKLKDKEYFNTVHIINGGRGIEWVGGQDIAPHELYELSQ